jgi:hypothetical protein
MGGLGAERQHPPQRLIEADGLRHVHRLAGDRRIGTIDHHHHLGRAAAQQIAIEIIGDLHADLGAAGHHLLGRSFMNISQVDTKQADGMRVPFNLKP